MDISQFFIVRDSGVIDFSECAPKWLKELLQTYTFKDWLHWDSSRDQWLGHVLCLASKHLPDIVNNVHEFVDNTCKFDYNLYQWAGNFNGSDLFIKATNIVNNNHEASDIRYTTPLEYISHIHHYAIVILATGLVDAYEENVGPITSSND